MSVYELSSIEEPPGSAERTPPQDIAAEASVLGAMLLSKDAISDAVEIVRAEDFYRPSHALIFDAILEHYVHDNPADAVTIAAELTRRGELSKIGGAGYLHTLVAGVPTAANADYYATIVRERAVMRRLVEAGTRIVQMGYAGTGDVDDVVDRAQQEVYEVTDKRQAEDYKPLSDLMEGVLVEIEGFANKQGRTGVPTGFDDLDRLTMGFHPGQLIIVAARPGMGKSTLAMDFARAAAIKNSMPAAFFSLEMSTSEIVMRLLSAETSIDLGQIRSGKLNEAQWKTMARYMGELAAKPLFLDDSANLTMMEIRAKARRLKQRHDIKLIVVDYIQLMTSGKKVENRQQEVSEFSRQMKLLAKELDIPVIALSQLNRGPETRTDKRPMLSDLRESGSLEQDADMVILIHREEAYNKDSPRGGEADLIVAKHRNGQTMDIAVAFQGHRSRFQNMARV
ncbi:MAG: replicative helicase [Actinomycetota bacterium]|jgi:replicative DNA helicase